jgi:hypothetical protein
MTTVETYEFIGELAISLYSKKIKISLSALNAILQDRNSAYGSNRGLAAGVSAAYRYWKIKDPVIHHAIAFTFNDKNGDPAWAK